MNPISYPTWRYHATQPSVIVRTPEEDATVTPFDQGWRDAPGAAAQAKADADAAAAAKAAEEAAALEARKAESAAREAERKAEKAAEKADKAQK